MDFCRVGSRREGCVFTSDYLIDKGQYIRSVERRHEATHLVQDTADGPYVCLLTVRMVLHDFRAGSVYITDERLTLRFVEVISRWTKVDTSR